MPKSSLKVCVRVDCRCSFDPGWIYYPKNIVGLHRINASDLRAKVGSKWTRGEDYCHGAWYSQLCEEEDCDPNGKVVEVISDCNNCPHRDKCSWLHKPV